MTVILSHVHLRGAHLGIIIYNTFFFEAGYKRVSQLKYRNEI